MTRAEEIAAARSARCRSCGTGTAVFWEECLVCDGAGQEREDGMDWCFNCGGSGGEWLCDECLHPEDDSDEP